jgi:hypothetical protein
MSLINSIKACEKSVNPSIQISLTINYNESKIPLSLEGGILSSDNMLLANFCSTSSMPQQTQDINLFANNSYQERYNQSYNSDVIMNLTKEALDYIEKIREKNTNKDVILRINFKIKYLISNVLVSHLFLSSDKQYQGLAAIKQCPVVYDNGGNTSYANVGDMNILSGNNGKSFLKLKTDNFNEDFKISASDWINNYTPKLGLGKYIILEIPEPDIWEEEKFKELISIKNKVKSHLDQGNWNDAISNSRMIFELLGKEEGLKEFLKNSFTDQCFPDEAINDFFAGISGLFDFTSKFAHVTDRSKSFQPCPIAYKEDAYIAYSIISNLLNMISKKIQIQG